MVTSPLNIASVSLLKHVNKKLVWLSVITMLISTMSFAQSAEAYLTTFKKSFTVVYPSQLSNNCIPTATILKIAFNDNYKPVDFTLSDSADLFFVLEFQKSIPRLDKDALEKYATYAQLKNSFLMVPIYFSFTEDGCKNVSVKFSQAASFMKFNKESFNGPSVWTSPIQLFIGKANN